MDNARELANRIRERKLSVLFVEDNPTVMSVTTKTLKLLFRKVDTAKDGREALDLIDNNKYDLIITDINMPDIDGSTLIREIRKKCKIFPIIITTAHIEFKDIYKEQPNIVVVDKPYDIEELLMALDDFEKFGKVLVEDDIYEKMDKSYEEARKILDMLNENFKGK